MALVECHLEEEHRVHETGYGKWVFQHHHDNNSSLYGNVSNGTWDRNTIQDCQKSVCALKIPWLTVWQIRPRQCCFPVAVPSYGRKPDIGRPHCLHKWRRMISGSVDMILGFASGHTCVHDIYCILCALTRRHFGAYHDINGKSLNPKHAKGQCTMLDYIWQSGTSMTWIVVWNLKGLYKGLGCGISPSPGAGSDLRLHNIQA